MSEEKRFPYLVGTSCENRADFESSTMLNQIESSISDDKVLLSTRESKAVADAVDMLAMKAGMSRSKFISKLVQRELHQSESVAQNLAETPVFKGISESLFKIEMILKEKVGNGLDETSLTLSQIQSTQTKSEAGLRNFYTRASGEAQQSIDKALSDLKSDVDDRFQKLSVFVENHMVAIWQQLTVYSIPELGIQFTLVFIAAILALYFAHCYFL